MHIPNNKPTLFLSNFSIVRPKLEMSQDHSLEWLAKAYAKAKNLQSQETTPSSLQESSEAPRDGDVLEPDNDALERKLKKLLSRFGCDSKKIATRSFEVEDGSHFNFEKMEIYRPSTWKADAQGDLGGLGVGTLRRTQYFAQRAYRVFEQFYPTCETPPPHLIHVTCTGYSSPSAAQRIVSQRNWQGQTNITHAYHMGCYAAAPAIRMAQGFVSASGKPVDIVHTEICSLHLNPADFSPEQMVVNSLFADGHIRYQVSADPNRSKSLQVLSIQEYVIPETQESMSWEASEWGMKMGLSRDVPKQIGESLPSFLQSFLLNAAQIPLEQQPQFIAKAIFAIHPGGPKIIDSIQELLKLDEHQVGHSRKVLHQFGNMSSATLPHVWHSILEDPEVLPGQPVVSLVFGPGLTVFGVMLQKFAQGFR